LGLFFGKERVLLHFVTNSCGHHAKQLFKVGGQASRGREDEVESRRASSRGLIPKAKVKTVKMTFVIISVFILCWSPYIFFDLLQVASTTYFRQFRPILGNLDQFWAI
jgi:hypothetical protein